MKVTLHVSTWPLSPHVSYNFEDAKRAPHKFSPSEDANCDGHLTSDRHGRPGVRS